MTYRPRRYALLWPCASLYALMAELHRAAGLVEVSV